MCVDLNSLFQNETFAKDHAYFIFENLFIDEEEDDEISDDLSESPDLSDDENAQEDIKQELLKEMARLKERLPDIHEASKTNETVKTVQEIVKHDTKKEPSTSPLTPIKKSRFTVKHRRSVSFGDVSERLFSQEQSQPAINFSEGTTVYRIIWKTTRSYIHTDRQRLMRTRAKICFY